MRKAKEKYYLYIGFCFAVLPVLFLRDFTPANELRYLSIADEALRNGTLFTFYSHGVAYADKPPLYLWIVMLLRSVFGSHQVWALSLASLIPALATVRIMDNWTKGEMDAGNQSVARMMLLTSGLFTGLALTLRMDMLMCMFIVLAMRSFWHIYTNDSRAGRARWLFPVYLFLALFTKGPLGVLIPLCCILVFLGLGRQWKRIAEVLGWRTWLVLLAGCGAWFGMVYAEGGTEYLNNLLFHQTVDRAVNSFHHNKPFYFYFECMWYCLAPWSLLVVYTIVAALRKGVVTGMIHKFLITSAITTMALLSCISSKLQVYMLPAVPFLVYASAIYLPRVMNEKWCRLMIIIPAAVLALALPGVVVASRFDDMQMLFNPMIYMAALALSAGSVYAIYLLTRYARRNYIIEEAIKSVGAGMLVAVYMAAFALPQLNRFIGYRELSQTAMEFSKEEKINRFTAWDMSHARDMDVYLKAPVNIIPDEAEPMDSIKQNTMLFIPAKDLAKFAKYETRTKGNYAVVAIRVGK